MNLNELWIYEDEIDMWAAQREFEMRERSYELARGGVITAINKAVLSFNAIREALVGLDYRGRS